MVSKFWQPGIDFHTVAAGGARRTVLLDDNAMIVPADARRSKLSAYHGTSMMKDRHSLIPIRKMRGQVSSTGAIDRRLTVGVSLMKVKKSEKPKNGGKKLVGLERGGNRSSLLTFERKPSKLSAIDMDPKVRVQTLLRIYEKHLRNQRGKGNQWDVVKHVKQMYREYLTPTLNQSRFGSIPGIQVGDIFASRAAMSLVGLHVQSQAGIDYVEYTDPKDGRPMLVAVSVVVSGVYEDDYDEGDMLMYTGEGGNDLTGSKKQIKDQKLEAGNLALAHSFMLQFPVRVIRARPLDVRNPSSTTVYSYDGLYKLDWWRREDGISKFKVFKYRMIREPNQPPLTWFRNQQVTRFTWTDLTHEVSRRR